MIWWKYCDIIRSMWDVDTEFLSYNDFDGTKSPQAIAIAMSYFMFTSLSTVGLGDFHPTNDQERAFGTILLLFGVLVTSSVI